MKLNIRYLVEDMDRHGNVRLYLRIPGRKKVRIREAPGTPEFWQAYNEAVESAAKIETSDPPSERSAPPGTLLWLIRRYVETSSDFRRLGPRTQHIRRGILEAIALERFGSEPIHGHKPHAKMQPTHVRRIRDEKAEFPEAANARVKALRQLFKWAADPTVRLAESNPAKDVPYFRTGDEGFHTWTIAEVQQFEATHAIGTTARLALALLLYTGVRRSDLVKLGPQMERNGWLSWTETKGRSRTFKARELPILPELRRIIDASPSGQLVYLVTARGRPFSPAGFGNRFRKWCNAAGLPHCSAHGLRKAGATIAADNGATEHELMAIYGWESPKQAAHYTRKANRKRLARGAMHRLLIQNPETDSEQKCPTADADCSRVGQNGQKTQ